MSTTSTDTETGSLASAALELSDCGNLSPKIAVFIKNEEYVIFSAKQKLKLDTVKQTIIK